jgi:hypothetical protein
LADEFALIRDCERAIESVNQFWQVFDSARDSVQHTHAAIRADSVMRNYEFIGIQCNAEGA